MIACGKENVKVDIDRVALMDAIKLADEEGYCCGKATHRANRIYDWLEALEREREEMQTVPGEIHNTEPA